MTDSRDARRRRGAVLICVMVMLSVVGLLLGQTVRTSSILAKKAVDQRRLRQANEVLDYVRTAVLAGELVADQQFQLQVPDGLSNPPRSAAVNIQRSGEQTRVVVRYPLDLPSEVVVSWER